MNKHMKETVVTRGYVNMSLCCKMKKTKKKGDLSSGVSFKLVEKCFSKDTAKLRPVKGHQEITEIIPLPGR